MTEVSRLPGPLPGIWEWQRHGSCREADPALFFPPDGERGPSRRERAAAAQEVCRGCPVTQECRTHALTVREPYGVWGGLTEEDRAALFSAGGFPVGRFPARSFPARGRRAAAG